LAKLCSVTIRLSKAVPSPCVALNGTNRDALVSYQLYLYFISVECNRETKRERQQMIQLMSFIPLIISAYIHGEQARAKRRVCSRGCEVWRLPYYKPT
jgi:hypothetical protein